MADNSASGLKRPHPEDDGTGTQKRTRSNNGSPAPGQGASVSAKPDIEKMVAEARARAEAVRARLQASRGGASLAVHPSASSPSPPPPPPSMSPAMSKLEQMKARVAAATSRASAASAQQRTAAPTPSYQPPVRDDEGLSKARGGLDVGLHPALLADTTPSFRSARDRQQQKTNHRRLDPSKQLDLSGPSVEEIKNQPYFDPSLGPKATVAKPRHSRQLIFNEKGKYIQQAAALRRQAQLEAMKKRIAEKARQAGLDEDIDLEKAYMVPAPPAVEWWDEGLISGTEYSVIDDAANLKIDTADSIITRYVQHPILLEPPQEKHMPAQKPMHLTPKEQAKIRRQRRMADLKEQQAKIRLGLEPAPAPKVKKSNLMRVLGEQAVKDPTAVEARVNREIAERKEAHEMMNEERKLTKEQRREKLAAQQEKDAELGIHVSVYRIDSLASGRNRFKISKNAEQNALTGICVMHPKLNLVIVEGGKHSINNYRKLMLNRIDWTDNPGPSTSSGNDKDEGQPIWLSTEDENGEPRDFGNNTCTLLWEGQAKTRVFRKWLGARVCETDSAAKDVLTRSKMENFWTLAKSAKPSEF
ncbi:U4/U6 small nuclear ribonucleoprotein/Pre-mRNA processing factor 3 [Penicillium ucsense]|uniref:U4/U6 small nuclear ribonucleoprotein/Pre-mRNA processing factor 3 n=1 Tax=Penicillium ucsense TaxID=2839758 RepID=A0A8J8W835_9EURO|nr:U4/U6 small nuclear ribonucleoprotein/Pre-mRNA processing factor 3 [Penicillium ucsense]KAF7734496.1 U4/U6 small nuclear ribonucleoprotein/Pre-mRNA processing factor 3 [Penicillium ucsense]